MSFPSMLGELATTSARAYVKNHEATEKMNKKIIDDTTRRVIDVWNRHLPTFLRQRASDGFMSAKVYVRFGCYGDKPDGPTQTFPLRRGGMTRHDATFHIVDRPWNGTALAPEDTRFYLPREQALRMVWGQSWPQALRGNLQRALTDHFSLSCKDWPPTISFNSNTSDYSPEFSMVVTFNWEEAARKHIREEVEGEKEEGASKKAKVQTTDGKDEKDVEVKVESD